MSCLSVTDYTLSCKTKEVTTLILTPDNKTTAQIHS